jgi:hypothetical protein
MLFHDMQFTQKTKRACEAMGITTFYQTPAINKHYRTVSLQNQSQRKSEISILLHINIFQYFCSQFSLLKLYKWRILLKNTAHKIKTCINILRRVQ